MFCFAVILLYLIGFSKSEILQNCTCLPYYQCSDDTGNVVMDGNGLIDVRGYKTSNCTGYFDVCCDIANGLVTTETSQLERKGCGYHNMESDSQWSGILLNHEIPDHEGIYKCGVSLIHPQVALTAAHCLQSPNKYWSINIADTYRQIVSVVVHPYYNSGTLQNDLVLLFLKTPYNHAEIVCIPPPGTILDGSHCSAITKDFSKIKIIQLPIVGRAKCQNLLRETRLGPYFQLHSSFLCAGGEDFLDVCEGDGGSPLICPIPAQTDRFHQVGIVSWGIGCGENNTPGVYVDLSKFRDWIDEEMIRKNFNINTYRY
ncbi:PREDICTED: tryptase beta-2-like [Nicrophorus vespilloides]|uniref:Tryptase beta-2-like n=1 Tax=Nicrophorus vespilloides TaxID=110193 RepID=A0ABM1N8N1_NICVS|nr:PREDICTED: tryptase beta-2-like [Nicrophorus vespilloides]